MVLAGLGTIGVGATSGSEASSDGEEVEEATPSAVRIVAVMLLLCGAVAALPLVHARQMSAADRRARAAKPSASVYGLQACCCPLQPLLKPPLPGSCMCKIWVLIWEVCA